MLRLTGATARTRVGVRLFLIPNLLIAAMPLQRPEGQGSRYAGRAARLILVVATGKSGLRVG